MSLNWIHTSVYAPKPILEEIQTSLKPLLHKADDLLLNTDKDGKPYLFTDTWEEEAIDKTVQDVSKNHPNDYINMRYLSSSPGAYHEIKSHYTDGQEIIDSDTVDYIQISLEEDMENFMDPEA